jgi:hypothetical protein
MGYKYSGFLFLAIRVTEAGINQLAGKDIQPIMTVDTGTGNEYLNCYTCNKYK